MKMLRGRCWVKRAGEGASQTHRVGGCTLDIVYDDRWCIRGDDDMTMV